MAIKGYTPALKRLHDLEQFLGEIDTYAGFARELLGKIDQVVGPEAVTKAELKRDFGFTESGLRLLAKTKQLLPGTPAGKRPAYSLAAALKIRVLQPELAAAPTIRTVRKHQNITTIYREFCNKLSAPGCSTAQIATVPKPR